MSGILHITKKAYETIHRQIKGAYSKEEALLDLAYLINEANGELNTSAIELGRKWHWPKSTVADFLNLLVEIEFIRRHTSKKGSIITYTNNLTCN